MNIHQEEGEDIRSVTLEGVRFTEAAASECTFLLALTTTTGGSNPDIAINIFLDDPFKPAATIKFEDCLDLERLPDDVTVWSNYLIDLAHGTDPRRIVDQILACIACKTAHLEIMNDGGAIRFTFKVNGFAVTNLVNASAVRNVLVLKD